MGQPHASSRRRIARESRILAGLAAFAVALLALAALLAPTASAETFGQTGSWGGFGTGKAQFRNPAMLGVDPSDGSVYAGDVSGDGANYRIQKLTAGGEFKGSALIPRFEDEAKLIPVTLHGIAVDHEKERIYVIRGCKVLAGSSTCQKNTKIGTVFNAGKVLVYKTAPEGENLVSAGSFNLPEGAEELYAPQTIAVDPSNNDLVIMAEDSAKHIVIQRFSSSGTPGARFVDSSNTLRPAAGREATSIAVGPTGITYTLTGASGSPGAKFTRAWELPSDLSSAAEVSGFAAAAEAEEWFYGLESKKSVPTASFGGPQIAISPDGSTLYWKESQTESSEATAGIVLVRGYSLSGGKTTVLYGGGSKGSCEITTSAAGIATTGGKVVVFDYGQIVSEGTPAYGDRVLTFGPGGSGCPIPIAKFSVNGLEQNEVKVEKGTVVTFNASSSELFEGFRRELIWNFGDGKEEKVTSTINPETEIEEEAVLTTSHTYTSAGKFTVSLEIKLKDSPVALVGPVEHVLNVQGGVSSFLLKVKKEGSGTGTVTSAPTGINCGVGAACEALFSEGSVVTLSGEPDPGSKPVQWTGCGEVTGENKCKVTMSAAKEVTAKFDLEQHLLKVKKEGSGTGTVTSAPVGINCGTGVGCEASYDHNAVVVLTGASDPNVKPVQWTGCGEVTGENKCKVTMSAAKEVTAKFDLEQHLLKVKKEGTGAGTSSVTSSPVGIDCGDTCEANFDHSKVITLSGIPGANVKPVQWTGCGEVTGENKCKVTMSAAKEVTAKFDPVPGNFLLKVERTGNGAGTVKSSPTGVNCGEDCEELYEEGKKVTLTAEAAGGSKFTGWSGGGCSGTGSCEVTIPTAETKVKAEFTLEQHQLKVVKGGTGTGTVTSTPAGIDCGATCQANFNHGAAVTLKGAAGADSKAVQWVGCDSIVGANECKVTMTAVKEVTATFDPNPTPPPSGGGSQPPVSTPPPVVPPVEPKPKLTPKQKALAKCKKLKGKAKAKCVKKANSIGKPKKHHRSRG